MGNIAKKCSCIDREEYSTYINNKKDLYDLIPERKAKSSHHSKNLRSHQSEDIKILQSFSDYRVTDIVDDHSKIVGSFRVIQRKIKIFLMKRNYLQMKSQLLEELHSEYDKLVTEYSSKNLQSAEKLYPNFNRDLIIYIKDNNKLRVNTLMLVKNNSVYRGEVGVDCRRNGIGTLIYNDGRKYEGLWYNDEFAGYGRYIDSEGNMFEGEFDKSKFNSSGIKRSLNSQYYKGSFVNFKKEGKGVEITKEYEYEGEFKNDIKHGNGLIKFNNGEIYEGQFTEDKITGVGKYTWKNKHTYEGDFIDAKMHGKGTYKWPDGSEYFGDYVNNIKEGMGNFKWPNGRIYKGPFIDGKPKGKGILIEKESLYDVEFDKGQLVKSVKRNQQLDLVSKNSHSYDLRSLHVKNDEI